MYNELLPQQIIPSFSQLLKEINVLFNAIEKLPRKAEYEEIKNMVENKERILSTL